MSAPAAGFLRHLRLPVLTFAIGLSAPSLWAATVSFSPANPTVDLGDSITLSLIGTDFNAGSLDGGGIDLSFDPGILQVTSVAIDPSWEFPVPAASIDNTLGEVTGINFASFSSRTGNLTFATVTFLAAGTGESSLTLAENALSGFFTAGDPYPNLQFSQTGTIAVAQAVPLPGALVLFLTAAGMVPAWCRRRGR